MNNTGFLFTVTLLLLTQIVNGQELNKRSVQDYTPSVLISKGQTEFKLFNSLYTQTQFFDKEGSKLDGGGRSTFFTSIDRKSVV